MTSIILYKNIYKRIYTIDLVHLKYSGIWPLVWISSFGRGIQILWSLKLDFMMKSMVPLEIFFEVLSFEESCVIPTTSVLGYCIKDCRVFYRIIYRKITDCALGLNLDRHYVIFTQNEDKRIICIIFHFSCRFTIGSQKIMTMTRYLLKSEIAMNLGI